MDTALKIARPGGAVGRVGVPQDESIPAAEPSFYNNVVIAGGPGVARRARPQARPAMVPARSAGLPADDPIPVQVTTLRPARELPPPMRERRDETVSFG